MQQGSQSAPSLPFEDFASRHSTLIRPSTMLIASLTALTLFILVGIRRQAPLIEQDISARATAAFSDAGLSWVQIAVDGRDLTVFGVAPSASARNAAYQVAVQLDGVRLARNRTALRTWRSAPDVDAAAADAVGVIAPHIPYALELQSDGVHLTLRGE